MKQLFLGLTALISMTAFSQKEELKTLKKLKLSTKLENKLNNI